MTLADLIKDFIDTTKERLKTPISGAFLWSFIICNWRPIFLLLFSDASIENKIIVINHEYCNFWAIFWPIVIATFYTLLIPKIMLQIENDLAPTQDERVTKRYESEKHLVQQKTNVAREEFLLKSAESGSKEIQELQDEIQSLKQKNEGLQESIKQINDSNKKTVDELNNSLKLANVRVANTRPTQVNLMEYAEYLEKEELQAKFTRLLNNFTNVSRGEILKVVETLSKEERVALESLDVNDKGVVVRYKNIPSKLLNSLKLKDIIKKEVVGDVGIHELTQKGHVIYKILKAD